MLYADKTAQGARLVTKEVKAAHKTIGTASAKYVDAVQNLDAASTSQRAKRQELDRLEAALAVAQVAGTANDDDVKAVETARVALEKSTEYKESLQSVEGAVSDYLSTSYALLSAAQDDATRAQWEAVEREALETLYLSYFQYCAAGDVTAEQLHKVSRNYMAMGGFVGSVLALSRVIETRVKALHTEGLEIELTPPAVDALWRSAPLKNDVYSIETPHYSQLIQSAEDEKQTAQNDAQTLGAQIQTLRADVATLDAQIEKIVAGGLDATQATGKRANLDAQIAHKLGKKSAALANVERLQEKIEGLESAQNAAVGSLQIRTKRAQLNEANATYSHGLARLLAAAVLFESVFGKHNRTQAGHPYLVAQKVQEFGVVEKSIRYCFK